MDGVVQILLISGSLRDGSTNTAVLRTAGEVAPAEVKTVLYAGMGTLPHFNPDSDREGEPVAPPVRQLRKQIAAAVMSRSVSRYQRPLAHWPGTFWAGTAGRATTAEAILY